MASVRALLKIDSHSEIWEARQLMETTLSEGEHVVGFFSCGTALSQKVKEGKAEHPGLAFWVMFDWPEYGTSDFAFHHYFKDRIGPAIV